MDRLDSERDAKQKAERKAYGEPDQPQAEEKAANSTEEATVKATANSGDDMTFGNFKVEVRRGPAPDSSKGIFGIGAAGLAAKKAAHAKEEERIQAQIKVAEEAGNRAGKDTPAYKQAQSVIAKLNAQLRATRLVLQSQLQAAENPAMQKSLIGGVTPDSTEFHAIIPINDYPQKARWRVTNKETMSQVRAPPSSPRRATCLPASEAYRHDRRVCDQQGCVCCFLTYCRPYSCLRSRHLLRTRQGAAP